MSNLLPRKVISLAALLSFIIVQFALISPSVSAQGEITPTPLPTIEPTPQLIQEDLQNNEAQLLPEMQVEAPLSTAWSPHVNISNTAEESFNPRLAIGDDASVHVVWREAVNGAKQDIFYKRFDGTNWSSPVNVSLSTSFASDSPKLVVDGGGIAHVVWQEEDNDHGDDFEILYSRCDETGCTSPTILSDGVPCDSYVFDWKAVEPTIGIDSSDRLMVVWMSYEPGFIGIMYSLWPAPGLPPANRTGCHSNVGVYRDPVVAGDSNGSFHLLMKGDILVNILYSNFSGSSWSSLQDLGSGSDPIIYVDQNNTVHAAWLTTTAPVYKTKEAGASWSSTENIFDNAFCIDLSLTVDRDNSPRLTCRNNGFIYETSRQAGAWTEATIITGNEGNAGQPTIASDVLGNLHMVWSDLRTGNWEIFYTIDPAYDCSDIVLSPIAQAIQAEVDQKEYCGNHYDDGLITLPPGEEAFDQFFNLVLEAKYEIDFTTMIWDAYRPDRSELGDSPGIILLKGLQELAVKIQNNPLNYPPEGVHVRILLGLKEGAYREPSDEPHHEDQRLRVLDDLETLSLLDDPKLNIEVALYRDGEIKANHSHAKMMIIDGREVIVTGYNMQYSYLNGSNRRDMGLQVSGPIAAHSLQVFDKLWAGARQCVEYDANHCIQEATVGLISHNPAIISTGNDIVFSLYRDGDRTLGNGDKTADRAIIAAIKAASTNVHIMQDRFMNPYVEHQPYNIVLAEYARAILDALEKEGSQVNVKLLVSKKTGYPPEPGDILNTAVNTMGICSLKEKLALEDSSKLQYFEARFSKFPMHTKALSIDNSLVIIGSQNFDWTAFGDKLDLSRADYDLAEYSLAIDSTQETNTAADDFDSHFMAEWHPSNSDPVVCASGVSVPLQSVIDQAVAGSIIFIPEGIYSESVTIDKPLVLVGSDSNQTIIQTINSQPVFRVTSSDVTIMNMKISGSMGYGIELIETSPSSPRNIQINHIVFENNAQGGILIQGLTGGSPIKYTIENNTFIGGAAGVTIDMPEMPADASIIRNNIFSGQAVAPIHILSWDDSKVEYSYNLFDDCGTGNCATNWRVGNMSGSSSEHDNLFDLDPLFTDAANGAYQLSAGSPAIDAGDPSLLHETFYDGDNDGIAQIDIGAFEYMDEIPPTVSSVQIASVQSGTVDFTVTFSEPVTGVDTPHFTLTTTNAPGAVINSVSGSGTTYTVSVNIGTGDGSIRLDVLDDDTILDLAGNPLNGGFTGGETYTIPSCNLVTHSPRMFSGNTMWMTITNPTGVALELEDIFVRWDHDRGHLVGLDKSLILQQVALGSTTLWSGSQAGPTYTFSTNATLPSGTSTIAFTFHQAYDRSDGSENIRINLATDGCQAYPIDSDNLLTQTPGAKIYTIIGGVGQGSDFVANNISQRKSYVGVNTGPVEIRSTNTVPVTASERVIYKVNNVDTSYSEMMALPDSQLDTTYWFPWYNNIGLDTQLRFANTTNTPAMVHVYIGGTEMTGSPFTLAPGESMLKSFPAIDAGPVKIVSNVPIVASERMIYKVNNVYTSYSEMMGLPNSQLDTTFWFPWYNNVDLDTQLRFANVSSSTATVRVYVGGTEMAGSPFTLAAGASLRQSFAGINAGPVKIVSNVPIVAAERVIYYVGGVQTSYSEMMGLPNSQLDTTFWFPSYNNVELDTQLRIANVSASTATVRIYVAGVEITSGCTPFNSPFPLAAGASTRISCSGVNNGPVKVVSDTNIVAAARVAYKVNNVYTSLSEMMGLPDSQLDTTYWMPWYNNLDLLSTELILAVGGETSSGEEGFTGMSSELSEVLEGGASLEIESASETEATFDPFDITIEDGSPFWQGLIPGASQDSFVTFTNIHTPVGEQHSNGIWSEDSIQVLYDTPSQRIQVWTYSAETGWTQRGEDMFVTFADGDVFQARALEDGTVEIYQNGTLLIRQGTTMGKAPELSWFTRFVSYFLPTHFG